LGSIALRPESSSHASLSKLTGSSGSTPSMMAASLSSSLDFMDGVDSADLVDLLKPRLVTSTASANIENQRLHPNKLRFAFSRFGRQLGRTRGFQFGASQCGFQSMPAQCRALKTLGEFFYAAQRAQIAQSLGRFDVLSEKFDK